MTHPLFFYLHLHNGIIQPFHFLLIDGLYSLFCVFEVHAFVSVHRLGDRPHVVVHLFRRGNSLGFAFDECWNLIECRLQQCPAFFNPGYEGSALEEAKLVEGFFNGKSGWRTEGFPVEIPCRASKQFASLILIQVSTLRVIRFPVVCQLVHQSPVDVRIHVHVPHELAGS